MWFLVILTATKTKLVVPIQWFQSIDIAQVFQIGLRNSKVHRIFYDADYNTDPNFRLPIRNEFNEHGENPPARYEVKVLKCFGQYIHAFL